MTDCSLGLDDLGWGCFDLLVADAGAVDFGLGLGLGVVLEDCAFESGRFAVVRLAVVRHVAVHLVVGVDGAVVRRGCCAGDLGGFGDLDCLVAARGLFGQLAQGYFLVLSLLPSR